MPTKTFIVVDRDTASANRLCRALSEIGYAFPVASLDEVGEYWPKEFSIFVADEGGQLNEVISFIRKKGIFYPIIPYSSGPSAQRVVETIKCGVMSYLNWPCTLDRLKDVVATIGESCDILYREKMSRERAFGLLQTLTPREALILGEITKGLTSKDISEELDISPRTVEVHRAAIFAKLNVKNVVGAVRTAFEAKFPTLPATYQ